MRRSAHTASCPLINAAAYFGFPPDPPTVPPEMRRFNPTGIANLLGAVDCIAFSLQLRAVAPGPAQVILTGDMQQCVSSLGVGLCQGYASVLKAITNGCYTILP